MRLLSCRSARDVCPAAQRRRARLRGVPLPRLAEWSGARGGKDFGKNYGEVSGDIKLTEQSGRGVHRHAGEDGRRNAREARQEQHRRESNTITNGGGRRDLPKLPPVGGSGVFGFAFKTRSQPSARGDTKKSSSTSTPSRLSTCGNQKRRMDS